MVSDKKKGVSSTAGMETSTKTSELLKVHLFTVGLVNMHVQQFRAENIVEGRIKEMEDAIAAKDFPKFAELTMRVPTHVSHILVH